MVFQGVQTDEYGKDCLKTFLVLEVAEPAVDYFFEE